MDKFTTTIKTTNRAGSKGTIIAATTTIKTMTEHGSTAIGTTGNGTINGTVDGIKETKTFFKMCAKTSGAPKDHNGKNHSNPSQCSRNI